MPKRKVAVLKLDRVVQLPAGRNYLGVLSSDNSMDRKRLPNAQVLVIEQAYIGRDTGYFLYRYTKDGDPAGDTWHLSEEEAMRAAVGEYGLEAVSDWIEVPENVKDEVRFAVQAIVAPDAK